MTTKHLIIQHSWSAIVGNKEDVTVDLTKWFSIASVILLVEIDIKIHSLLKVYL